MLKEILQKLKNVFTIKEWNVVAQEAIANKEFVVEPFINKLHEARSNEAHGRVREQEYVTRVPSPTVAPVRENVTRPAEPYIDPNQPLKGLLDSVKMAQRIRV